MKKILYLVIAVVAISVYSCQKDSTAPRKATGAALLKTKKDTTPPGFTSRKFVVQKDTTPPGK